MFLLRPGGQPRISCYPELSGLSSEQAVKAASVMASHSVHHILIYLINSGSIFQSADSRCRPYVDRRCSPEPRLGKIKYFTVGGFAIKLRAQRVDEGIQTQHSTLEILQNWSR